MKAATIRRSAFACVLAAVLSAATESREQKNYQFRSFAVCPGCPTSTGGINNEGLVGASRPGQGYVYNSKTDSATPVPGALATTVPSEKGTVPGLAATLMPLISQRD